MGSENKTSREEIIPDIKQLNLSVSNFEDSIPALLNYFQLKCDNFQAGYVSHCFESWKQLSSDNEILSTVSGAHIELHSLPIQHPRGLSGNKSLSDTIHNDIHKWLSKGIIEPATDCKGQIINSIFTRSKKDGSNRIILNLAEFNEHVVYRHFKMDTLSTIKKLVQKECFMASLDLKDAYFSVPVCREDRKFLRFIWREKLYQFTCLPNGLSSCPRIFTKLLKPPMATLHKLGHISSNYLDDLFLTGKTYKDCVKNVIDTMILFDDLGFTIHPEKSIIKPTQTLVALGFLLNSVTMTVRLTSDKAFSLKSECLMILSKHLVTIREVSRMIGLIVSSFPGVMHGPLYYRNLEAEKSLALKRENGNYEAYMSISESAKVELRWWSTNVMTAYSMLSHGNPDFVLTTDASLSGWGACFEDTSTGGMWSVTEKCHHINYLELLAVFQGLKTFVKLKHDIHTRVMTDNTTTIACINHMGTSHSPTCNALAKDIWEWCINRKIWLSACHIAGKFNTIADSESRKNASSAEWQINSRVLQDSLSSIDFLPEIDLFASRLNFQFPRYCAYKPDPGAEIIDAFTVKWENLKFYAFPPFSVISTVLQKIQQDRALGICILPDWPTQPWYPVARKMLIQEPIILQPSKTLLRLPSAPQTCHPLHQKLRLLVCLLSGNN